MQGRIYISGSFNEITSPAHKNDWRDNCPHFWTAPPTWGICRPDFRSTLSIGDYVFFVLPAGLRVPQMIYGYIKISEKVDHLTAYFLPLLASKRMGNKNPNGNILVDAKGNYNRFDNGQHYHSFQKIRRHYVIGDEKNSEFLNEDKIRRKHLTFQKTLNSIFSTNGQRPIDVISRKGRRMDAKQVTAFLKWLK